MSTRTQQSYMRPLVAAIAANATSPDPGITNAVVLSSTTGDFLRWNGSAWMEMGGGGGATAKQVEIDVGSTPLDEAEVLVTDGDVTATSKLFASVSADTPTGKDADDVPMDSYAVSAVEGAGELTIRIRSLDGRVHDKYLINYLIA